MKKRVGMGVPSKDMPLVKNDIDELMKKIIAFHSNLNRSLDEFDIKYNPSLMANHKIYGRYHMFFNDLNLGFTELIQIKFQDNHITISSNYIAIFDTAEKKITCVNDFGDLYSTDIKYGYSFVDLVSNWHIVYKGSLDIWYNQCSHFEGSKSLKTLLPNIHSLLSDYYNEYLGKRRIF